MGADSTGHDPGADAEADDAAGIRVGNGAGAGSAGTGDRAAAGGGPGSGVGVSAAIQPHGFLLGVDRATSVVVAVSANLARFVGASPAAALGRTLSGLLGPAVLDRLLVPGPGGRRDTEPRTVRLRPVLTAGAVGGSARQVWDEFEVVAHQSRDVWVLEFEPADPAGPVFSHDDFRRALAHLRAADGVAELCAVAAMEVRALTGFDRVLVCRFAGDGHRDVIAEARRPDLPTCLDLSFPVQEVDERALAVRVHGGPRLVVDVDAPPVGLVSTPGLRDSGGLDLTGSALQAPGPADTSDLRALGAAARLTVALVVDGQVWGQLTCDHQTPRRVSHQVRASCEDLARLLSLQVRSVQARVEHERRSRLDGLVAEVVAAMSLADPLTAGAAAVSQSLLAMAAADGVVLHLEGRLVTAGAVPAGADLDALISRVQSLAGDRVPPWATDTFTFDDTGPDAGADRAVDVGVAGVLYVPFGGRDGGYALWLRREQVRTVHWVAAPPTGQAGAPGWVVPVRVQTVRGRSRPWSPVEEDAAAAFAKAMPALLLHRAQRVLLETQLAAGAERLSAAADREHLEHQLHQHQRLESLGQLAGGVAHDFNNLLAVILNYTEFIGDAVDTAARAPGGGSWRTVLHDVDQVKAASGRAVDLTQQLLAFARRDVVQPRALNLNHVIRGVEELLHRSIGERVELAVSLPQRLQPVLADPGQVEQILVNLAVNARDAMPTGGTLTIATADVDVPAAPGSPTADSGAPPAGLRAGRWVRLEVSDTGQGMAPEILDRVFEPFFTTKPTGEGSGLGLATVHGIVTQIGGSITIDSEPGLGTTFTMVFPATDTAPTAAEPGTTARPRGGGETVLVVEDGTELREVTHRILSRAGYDVVSAANGYEALEVAARHPTPVTLLLTDLIMPFMTGDELADRMRTRHPGVRVLFMSGYAQPLLAAGARLETDDPLLAKPFSRSALLTKVLEVLDQPPPPAVSTTTAPHPPPEATDRPV